VSAFGTNIDGWKDLRASLVGQEKGAGAPTLTVFGPTGTIKQLAFGIGDSVFVAVHWDHDIKPGSICYPHVHWSTSGTSTNTVKWELTHITAAGHNTANFPADTVLTLEEAAAGTAWRHMVTEDPVGFVVPEIDAITMVELERITNGGTENADTVFGLFLDFHYQSGPYYGTPYRSPNFYHQP
jgi:hypothetical protein